MFVASVAVGQYMVGHVEASVHGIALQATWPLFASMTHSSAMEQVAASATVHSVYATQYPLGLSIPVSVSQTKPEAHCPAAVQ
jgi:hypothetical protein